MPLTFALCIFNIWTNSLELFECVGFFSYILLMLDLCLVTASVAYFGFLSVVTALNYMNPNVSFLILPPE